jgi:hypothetical protein
MRTLLRQLGRFWIRHFGSPLRDERTGELLGRALVFVWRGRIHLIGFTGEAPLKVVFHAQDKVRYWRQSVGFVRCPKPDFPKLPE